MPTEKRKATIGYTAYVTPEQDAEIMKYGEHLVQRGLIPKNTKYAIVKYLLDQVYITMTQSFLPGDPKFGGGTISTTATSPPATTPVGQNVPGKPERV